MPFFPEKSPRDSKKETQFKAEIYGIKDNMTTPFTPDEIEKMRDAVLKADREKISNNVFDLSKPPVVNYKHQEFPKLVYNHAASEPSRDTIKKSGNGNEEMIHIPAKYSHRIVKNADELAAAIDDGYSEAPPVLGHIGLGEEVEEETLDAPEGEDALPVVPRKKPGRKPKPVPPAA